MARKKITKNQHIAGPILFITPTPELSKPKIEIVIERLRHADGATLADLCNATGWQAHSVRGALSGTLKKARKLDVESRVVDGVRRYRIAGVAR